MEGQPFLVEARERPVEEKSPLPLPVEGAGTGPKKAAFPPDLMLNHPSEPAPKIQKYD